MTNDTKPAERQTSADIKRQIEEATKAAKDSVVPLTGMIAGEINAAPSIPDQTPAQVTSKPDPENHPPAAKSVESAKPTETSVDLKEWAKKRGIDWTTEESVLSALRKSDQAFHAKRQAEKQKEAATPNPYVPPQPPYVPPTPIPQPAYAPSVPNRAVIENIARQYNMTPEDAERLAMFNRDFFDAAIQRERQAWQQKIAEIERENAKNSVFRELSSDPVFRRPEVAVEYHNVLEQMQDSDPQAFEQNPNAYRRAYEMALANIARRNLEGRPLQEGVSPAASSMTPPSTPPRPLGQASGGGSAENENAIDPAAFAKLSLEDKRAVLERAGLRPAY